MLLTGTYQRSLDEKLRVAIPRELREPLCRGDKSLVLYVTPGTDGSLSLYTQEDLQRLARKLDESSPSSGEVRTFLRLFYAQAQRLEADSQYRIRLPANLADTAGLGRDIVILGVYDHLELWNRARWEEYLRTSQRRYDELAERAFSGGKRPAD